VSTVLGILVLAMGGLAIWAFNQRSAAEEQRGIAETKQKEAEKAREAEVQQRKEAERAREGEAAEKLKAETELKKAQAVSEFVWGIFTAVKPGEMENVSDEDKDLLKLVLGKGAERIKELEGQPEVEAPIRFILGDAYLSLGFYDEALVHGKKGEYDKALEHFQKALAIDLKKLGPEHPSVGMSYLSIGAAWWGKKDLTKAKEFIGKGHAILLKKLGPNHPNTKNAKAQLDALKE